MAEWLKAHDSKSCGPKGLGGSNPLASAINVGIEKDSKESFYIFKLKLKNEDSLSSASSSQKCKHFCELLLEGGTKKDSIESFYFYSLPLPVKTAATVLMRILIS